MINFIELERLRGILHRAKDDKLLTFVSQVEADQLEELLKDNLQLLFKEARKYKVRYIYIGQSEICGCERKNQPGSPWPAMWVIANNVGFPGSCGNTDQYQCHFADRVFPLDSYGGWDLKENRMLSDEEVKTMKFNMVTSRRWN